MPATIKPKRPSLRELLIAIQDQLEEIKSQNKGDDTRLLTAEELAVRWNVRGQTEALKLRNLGRLCKRRRVVALPGQDGWNATFAFADVLAGEGLVATS